jgi:hypothetical protein
MMRFLSATTVCLLLGSAGVIADQKNTPKKHKDATHAVVHGGDAGVTTLSAHVSWTTHDVAIIRRYYGPKYRNLPPGLRKKYQRTGQLPPGWQKKMEPFPATLERECEPLPAGYRRGVLDAHAVIYNSHGTIIDLAVLF